MYRLISSNHCPFCTEMAGKYPKDFKFWGWHPHCRCTTIPILKSWEQMDEDNERLIMGQPISESPERILFPKESFRNWVRDNKDKIERAKVKPFFIQNNEKYWKEPTKVKKGIDNLLKPREKRAYINFEPFFPIVREEFAKLKNRFEKRKLFDDILNEKDFKTLNIDDKTNKKTIIHPQSREPESKNWDKTQTMAKFLNKADKDVIFLPEYKDRPSADALLVFKGKYTIADFKYFTTTKANTIATELAETFGKTPIVVMEMKNADLGVFKEAINTLVRKNNKIGSVILVNKYGKIFELESSEFKNGKYINKIRGRL